MSRVVLVAALAAVSLLALAGAAGAGASAPQAQAARSCHLSSSEQRPANHDPTYTTSLSVKHTSCRNGKRVMRAFHKCRKGPRGRCHHRVKHFKCTEHRAGIKVQFDSSVNCKRGSKRVHFTYTQNT